ncbi:MAG: substrate-binding domain-containing protein [Halofilum sp. (in: g-proteobacteria)]|nr:substrate-binding domain-containing protein [Halofilum sp. (in: g-proteobacteria)]
MPRTIGRFTRRLGALAAVVMIGISPTGMAADNAITVASTTSTEASGLFGYVLPKFEDKTGIDVRVVAVGTGQAIEIARRGDADVLLVHHTPSEKAFVADGYGVERHPLMYNDFIIVGPGPDPAGIAGMDNAPVALARIAEAEAPFASRGDNSGTHKKELELWDAAGVDPTGASGAWYRETGAGMGKTLNTAAAMDAYALADRATWISFENRQGLELLVEGDERLFNPYGVILVSSERHPHVNAADGQRFIDWLTGEEGQQAIAGFRLRGQQLFTPNAD